MIKAVYVTLLMVITVLLEPIKPMLLHKNEDVPVGDYIHQMKFDGHRALLHTCEDGFKVYTRHGTDCTKQYPEFVNNKLNSRSVVLDGEMIAFNESGKPCFEFVMERFMTHSSEKQNALPVHFAAFDVLYVDDNSVMNMPLQKRLELLKELVVPSDVLSVVPSYEDGRTLLSQVKAMGLEGIVSKKRNSKYRMDFRSPDWLKVKNYLYETVSIAAIRKGDFGWSLIKDQKYVGIMEFVTPNARKAFAGIYEQLVTGEDNNWIYLDPKLSCRVKFQCWTRKGLMRSPSFVEFVF